MKAASKYIGRSVDVIDFGSVMGVLAILFVGLTLIAKYPPFIWVDFIADDAYYYLGIVRNLVDHGVSSFLPPFSTNGYQPLWVVLLSASAFIFGTSAKSLVSQIYAVSFVFLLLFCIASKLRYGVAFPAIAATASFFLVMGAGMETTMVPFFFILYTTARKWQWRGVLGSVLFLCRLDALSVVFASDLLHVLRRERIDLAKYAIIIPVILIYICFNIRYFGTPVPVSGLAKSIGNVRGENLATGINFLLVTKGVLPLLGGLVLYLLIVKKSLHLRYFDELSLSLIATVFCATYYAINSGWRVWGWYYWPILLLTYYLMLEAASIIKSHLQQDSGLSLLSLAGLIAALLFLSKPALGFSYHRILWMTQSTVEPEKHPSFGRENVELVAYLHAKNIRPGSFFAMGDRAGSFGFFLGNDYQFIHTEGLVGPSSYYEAMNRDKGLDFIDHLGIDYLVVDRQSLIDGHNAIGVIEPVQPMSSRFGDYILCFKKSGIVLDQSYINWQESFQQRYLLDFKQRIECPSGIYEQFLQLRKQYGGIAKFSLSDEFKER